MGAAVATLPARLIGTEKTHLIGWLGGLSGANFLSSAFLGRLGELGYAEGKNFRMEWRWLAGHVERFPEVAVEFARLQADVIVATGGEAGVAAQKAATSILSLSKHTANLSEVALG